MKPYWWKKQKRWTWPTGQTQLGFDLEEWSFLFGGRIYYDHLTDSRVYTMSVLCFYLTVRRWQWFNR